MTRSRLTLPTWFAAAALAATTVAVPAHATTLVPTATEGAPATASVASADLTMTGGTQQRWQSVPHSRIVANPFDRNQTTSEVQQNSNSTLPLSTAYYANDKALMVPNLLQTFQGSAAGPDTSSGSTVDVAGPYTAANGWTLRNVTSIGDGATTTMTVTSGTWGSLAKQVEVDLDATPYLTVDIASTTGAWNLKVNKDGSTTDVDSVIPDATTTGRHTFDLRTLTGMTGTHSLGLKLFTSGGLGKSTVINSLTLHAATADPAAGAVELFRDDMTTNSSWTTYKNSATLVSNGAQGIVKKTTASASDYGAVVRSTVIPIDQNTELSVRVPTLSHQWALKLFAHGQEKTIQSDTATTGTFVYNVSDLTGWSGSTSLEIRLYSSRGVTSSAVFEDLTFYDGSTADGWLHKAASFDTTWSTSALDYSATYAGAGQITGADLFHDTDALVRTVDATALTSGSAVVGGALSGSATWSATWSADTHRLTVTTADYVRVYQLPAAASVWFGTGIAGSFSATPNGTTTSWFASIPAATTARVAIGFAPVNAETYPLAEAIAHATTEATTAYASEPAAVRAGWTTFWNDYLATVPVPQDFELKAVDTQGVTADRVETMYYRAWVNLEQNVLPATPETGNLFSQLGTGKASTWMAGTSGTRNVASWDSLLGMQALVYTDPEDAWASFEGMMALVNDEGALGLNPDETGESLPSRKAQTAWILYQVTGDRSKLEAVYDSLARHLRWESAHLRWIVDIVGGNHHDDAAERDSEFAVSLLVDLTYATKISQELGRTADVADWAATTTTVRTNYERWFFPAIGGTLQKVAVDGSENVVSTSGAGIDSVVLGGLHVQDLSAGTQATLLGRFTSTWDLGKQLAGLANDSFKAPNAQFLTYGLLDHGKTTEATQLSNTILRDVVRTGWFAEVYQEQGDNLATSAPTARGVRPSLFGLSMFIDAVWMNNGYRLDVGEPSFLRLSADNDGGLSGLTTKGKRFDLDLDADTVALTGPAFNWSCSTLALGSVGTTTTIAPECSWALDPLATTTTLALNRTSQPAAAPAGSRAVATITVRTASGAAAPGTVALQDVTSGSPVTLGTARIAGGAADGSAQAAIEVPASIGTGARSLRAVFAADDPAHWAGSSSAAVRLAVVPVTAPVSVGLTVSSRSVSAGNRPSATVAVTTTGTWKPASVTLTDNGRVVATVTVPAAKSAAVRLPVVLTVGRHSLVAHFAGGAGLAAGTSSAVGLTVTKAQAKVALKRSKATVKARTKVSVRVTVSAPAGVTRRGKAVILVRGKKTATVTVPASGRVTVTVKLIKKGKNAITVRYLGSANLGAKTAKVSVRVR